MSSNKFGKDELIELFKEMKLTQKKYDEGIKIYEEKYEKNVAQKKEIKMKAKKNKYNDMNKQPLKPYFSFQKDVMNEYKNKGEKIKKTDISKMWKELDDIEKSKYIVKYDKELKIYNEKFNIQKMDMY